MYSKISCKESGLNTKNAKSRFYLSKFLTGIKTMKIKQNVFRMNKMIATLVCSIYLIIFSKMILI